MSNVFIPKLRRFTKRRTDESALDYVARLGCALPDMIVPKLREQRRLERMVGPAGLGLWSALQRFQITCLQNLGLTPDHRLLDIGCGPLQGGIAFIQYLDTGKYVGVDLRADAIAEAKVQIETNTLADKKPEVYQSATFGRDELNTRKFDFFWISQLLYHLDDDQLNALLVEFVSRTDTEGRLIGDFIAQEGDVHRSEDSWQEFSFYFRSFKFYEDLASKHGLTLIRHGKLVDHGYPTRWTYRLSRNELIELRRRPVA